MGRAAVLNLATLTCAQYEHEVLPAAAANPSADSLDTVMWLFGYSVAKSGAHVLYSDALAPFGAEFNATPIKPEQIVEAVRSVSPH